MEIVLVLYNIRSMHNVGSIFRTADAAGVRKIYLAGYTPSPLDALGKPRRQIAKVSLGAEETVAWEKIRKTETVLLKLKKDGFEIIALEQNPKAELYSKFKPKRNAKVALVLGNEINGIPEKILKIAGRILEIPMRGRKESLNVGVSAGIALFRMIDV